jgi:hypothetical protein
MEWSKMVTDVIRIGRDEANNAREAYVIAKARMGAGYKYTSTQRNSEGWSICFEAVTLLKTEEQIRQVISYFEKSIALEGSFSSVNEALKQRITALKWVLGEGSM